MSGAIVVTIKTKDNLLITSSINICDGKELSDFSVEPFFPAIETSEHPKHAFDINNPNDPIFIKLDELITNRLFVELKSLKRELKSMDIELLESETISKKE
jgi:hypothetical protein